MKKKKYIYVEEEGRERKNLCAFGVCVKKKNQKKKMFF
jgi:hypothetical protein